jgi:putative sigma-54 modulation protein
VHIEISTRHGSLAPSQTEYLHDKADKLVKYFERLMAVEVAVEHGKHSWRVEIRASAEHKHDFFASEEGPTPEAAMDVCAHKVEEQLRRYKERVQRHKGDLSAGDPSIGGEPA